MSIVRNRLPLPGCFRVGRTEYPVPGRLLDRSGPRPWWSPRYPASWWTWRFPLSDLDRASWIVTGYLVSYTVAMPLAGRLSDVFGRVRMFQAALVVFSIGSALVAVAPNFPWAVSARVIQAIGGGATVPIGLAMAVGAVAPPKRGVALGLVAASAEAGSVLGPLYGGAIIEWIGWRWIFWLDIPQSFILIALLALLPNRANPGAKMDYFGALALTGALTMLTHCAVPESYFLGRVSLPILHAGPRCLPGRRIGPGGATRGAAPAGLLPVPFAGILVLQHYSIPGRSGP